MLWKPLFCLVRCSAECLWCMALVCVISQIKSSKCETEIQALTLKSLLYLERYMYLILFNTYLHLEKRDSWQRSFSDWMLQVRSDLRHVHSLQRKTTLPNCVSGKVQFGPM